MIRLMQNTFIEEAQTKERLCEFIMGAEQLSMGEQVKRFEHMFAIKQDRKYAVMVSSGSMANLVLLQALKNMCSIREGQQVAVSALTWSTNVMPVMQMGFKPVLLDVGMNSLNVTPDALEERIVSHDIKALFLTHALGFCDDLAEIVNLCRRHGILLLEDTCESLGSTYGGRLLGNFGEAATFSFFVGHHLSTIEGGMVVTDSEALYYELLMVRAHGWDRNLPTAALEALRQHHRVDDFSARYTFYTMAYNARPTEIQGFLGLEQLPHWNGIVEARYLNYQFLQRRADANPELVQIMPVNDGVSCFAYPLVAKTDEYAGTLRRRLQTAGIEHRPIIGGYIGAQPFFRGNADICHVASFIGRCGCYVPNRHDLTIEELEQIGEVISGV